MVRIHLPLRTWFLHTYLKISQWMRDSTAFLTSMLSWAHQIKYGLEAGKQPRK
ncbi:hypothetical protein F442_21394 [Phytophthora nicotianae P10297]|uniref:Uncharacterized protein n=2 Tax=Phytophthora nicotianae TaxID=4792 RepID=W2Y3A9_PHYNI|nr:hypothetical protein F444_21568 [Phytophthora nicotianae P1976]ETP29461.1 hypothetical protein F442_21394 [Phytophthora nicotianae P10297]